MLNDVDLLLKAFPKIASAKEFGLSLSKYSDFGFLSDASPDRGHDFICISECRHCGNLNTTIAQNENGILMPMSAGRGPKCKEEKCGDAVAHVCYGFFRLRR